MNLPHLPRKSANKVLRVIKANKAVIIALLVGALIAVPTTLYVVEKQKTNNQNQVTGTTQQSATETNNTDPKTELPSVNASTPTATTPAQQGTATKSAPPSSSTTTKSTTPSATPAPTAPTQKAPYTYTFTSGNRTSNWYAGGTYFPGHGYTDEWLSLTGKADATGFLNWRLSYNCSSGSACPGVRLQGSNDGASWINYKTLSGTSGTYTYPVLYPYYRLMLSTGQCSENACPPPTPPSQ